MLRLRLLLGASCSFCLRIWNVDLFDDVVVELCWIVAADAVSCVFHYATLKERRAGVAEDKLVPGNVEGNAPVTPVVL